ncbi:hypothetical protein, partial [Stenotrophomonas maltophilia]|uniref:hypothetical protein n=1 Tax=Stenotrophomonas maltophilia TaxID=40324 RepID=UPI0019556705
MNAAKDVVDSYNGSEVDQFNTMVTDYNSRCGSFRYRSGSLESARRDVEQYRSQLIEEGRRRLEVYRQSQSQSDANEDESQSQDPLVGDQAQLAVQEAELDTAAPNSTSPGQETLPASTPGPAAEINPIRSSLPETRRKGPPANSFVSGATWYCNSGFRRVSDRCEALVVPENAFVSGASWYCNSGFKRVGDQCEALVVPANAFVSGASWYCNSGFRRVGDRCEAL